MLFAAGIAEGVMMVRCVVVVVVVVGLRALWWVKGGRALTKGVLRGGFGWFVSLLVPSCYSCRFLTLSFPVVDS